MVAEAWLARCRASVAVCDFWVSPRRSFLTDDRRELVSKQKRKSVTPKQLHQPEGKKVSEGSVEGSRKKARTGQFAH